MECPEEVINMEGAEAGGTDSINLDFRYMKFFMEDKPDNDNEEPSRVGRSGRDLKNSVDWDGFGIDAARIDWLVAGFFLFLDSEEDAAVELLSLVSSIMCSQSSASGRTMLNLDRINSDLVSRA